MLDLLGRSVDLLLPLLGHTTAQTQDEVQRRLLLDVVVGKRAAVFELLAREDQTLLVGRNAFFVLDLGFDIVDRVGGFYLERDRLTRDWTQWLVCAVLLLMLFGCWMLRTGFDEDLHRGDLDKLDLSSSVVQKRREAEGLRAFVRYSLVWVNAGLAVLLNWAPKRRRAYLSRDGTR